MMKLVQEELIERGLMADIEVFANLDGSVSYCGVKTFDYNRAASDLRIAYEEKQEQERISYEKMEDE